MTSKQGFLDSVGRRADRLPLPRIVAWMLGAAAAFFCLTMPRRLIDPMMGAAHLPGGMAGRMLFTTAFAGLLAWIGWRALTAVSAPARPKPAPADEVILADDPIVPRRRAFGPADEASPTLRRGDAHPDAPARRPIFASHDLGRSFDEMTDEASPAAYDAHLETGTEAEIELVIEPDADHATDIESARAEAEPEPVELAAPIDAIEVDREPFELVVPLVSVEPTPAPAPASPAEQPTLAQLMARFEGGLDRLDGDLPPPPSLSLVTPVNSPHRDSDEALRDALAALQRMATRQR